MEQLETTIVGRDDELAVLRAELDSVRAGRARVVLLEGPAGIGKTTLAEHFVAGLADARVLRASGDEFETEVELGLLEQLLRGSGPLAGAGHVEAGARLLQALSELQADGPAVLVVDDVQWADEASLRALSFAIRRLVEDAVLVLLAGRELERIPEALRKAADGRTGRTLTVAPLDAGDIRALAAELGVELSVAAARRLREHSAGNALPARALLAEVPAQLWAEPGAALPAPRSFAALVAQRLAATPGDAVRLLEAACVLGLHAPLALAADVAGVADPLAALDAPVAAELVRLDDGPAGPELRFAHPLIRASVYQQLLPARRAELHAAAATAVTDEWTALGHRVAASPGADAALAEDLDAFAGRCARAQAWAPAVPALVAASRLSDTRAGRERRLLAAVETAMYAGDTPRAQALAAGTGGFAPGPLLDAVLAYVAIGAGRRGEAEERLERAWRLVDPGVDAALAGRIAERTAFVSIIRLRAGDAVEWAQRAGALAGEEAGRARAAGWRALGLHWSGRRDAAYEALAGAPAGAHRGSLLLADDDLAGARAALQGETARPVPSRSLIVAARALASHARVEFAAGRWDDAALLAHRAQVLAAEAADVAAQAPAGWAAALVPAARGDAADCAALAGELAALPAVFENHVAEVALGRAELAAAQGRPDEVVRLLGPLAQLGHRDAVDHPGHWPWAAPYADALVALGRLAEADAVAGAHEAIAARHGLGSAIARIARVRGRLEAARGDAPAADAAHRRALEAVPAGMPYERALCELTQGGFLRRWGRRRAAAAALEAAGDTFAALGAEPMLARATRELDACGLTPAKRGPGADRSRLTPQERAIAQLAAAGHSNREVAAELLLSLKTVERHLTHVYRKLGIESRAALGDALAHPRSDP